MLTQAASENRAPTTAGSGTVPFRKRNESGRRNALGRPASRKRSAITDMCAMANVSIAPNAKIPARKSMSFGSASPKAISAGRGDHDVRGAAARVEAADRARDLAVGGERVGEPREPEHLPVHRHEERGPRHRTDGVARRVAQPLRVERRHHAEHGRLLEAWS